MIGRSALIPILADIRALARARGLSDAALAQRAGITLEALSRLGKRGGARFETIEKLARAVDRRIGLLPEDDHARDLAEGTLFDLSKWS